MDKVRVIGGRHLQGRVRPPGDATLSHAALLLGAMAEGHSLLEWLSPSLDVHTTWSCLMEMGVTVTSTPQGEQTAVRGLGWRGLIQPKGYLEVGDSCATAALLMGVIAGNPIAADIVGDDEAQLFPYEEIAAPLRAMGAGVHMRGKQRLPLSILGAALKGARHELTGPLARAAVLLAGTMALGETSVTETRDCDRRLEDLMGRFGAGLRREGRTVAVTGGMNLAGSRVQIGPDLYWAAFWALAAGLNKGGDLLVEGVAPDDARHGILADLARLGFRPDWHGSGLRVRALHLSEAHLADAADIPLLAVAASQARGKTTLRWVKDEGLLRLLKAFGIAVEAGGDIISISGPTGLSSARVSAREDERLARAALLAGLLAEGETVVAEAGILGDRYPGLHKQLTRLQ